MYGAKEILLSLSIQRHDSSLRQACASAFYENKHSSGFYLQYAWPSHHAMEQLFVDQLKLEQYAVAVEEKGQHWITAMDSSMVLLGQFVGLKITKELCTMATKEYTQSNSSLSLHHLE